MSGYVAFSLIFVAVLGGTLLLIRRIARTYPQPDELDRIDVRLRTLARRFEHSDDMSLEELEAEVDRILNGETMYLVDGIWRSYEPVMVCSNEPGAVWSSPSIGGTVIL